MPFGSLLAKNGEIVIETEDNKKVKVKNNIIYKTVLRIFGIPHIGLRVRTRIISRLLKLKKGEKILDAGCGIGFYPLYLSTKSYSCYGFDISLNNIKKAKRLAESLKLKDIVFKEGNIYKIPFKKKLFDKIVCSEVLEHIKNDKEAIKELARVLKNDGSLVTTFPSISKHNKEIFGQIDFEHARLGYSKDDIKNLFENNGFVIKKIYGYFYFFGRISWKINRYLLSRSKVFTVLTFYPLFLFSYLDRIIPLGECDGYAVLAKKK